MWDGDLAQRITFFQGVSLTGNDDSLVSEGRRGTAYTSPDALTHTQNILVRVAVCQMVILTCGTQCYTSSHRCFIYLTMHPHHAHLTRTPSFFRFTWR